MAGFRTVKRAGRRTVMLPLAAALMAGALAAPSFADGRVEAAPEVGAAAVAVAMPGLDRGDWRTRTQLVWDPTRLSLVRRTYTLWDPLASEGFDFVWTPDNPAAEGDGPIAGTGRLTWRVRGAPSYDRKATVAEYRGTLRNGRAEGEGIYLHRSGVSYRGAWHDGLMDGKGRLFLPNGDQYVGEFSKGRLDGRGVYIDATGTMYEGGFVAGLRQGEGLIRPGDGKAYSAVWEGGAEVPGSRRLAGDAGGRPSVFSVQYDELPNVSIGVLVNREPDVNDDAVVIVDYAAQSDGETLQIYPDNQRLLDVWRGRDNISLNQDESFEFGNFKPSFLGSAYRYEPVAVVFELDNGAETPLRIVGAYLDVAHSESDLDPAVQASAEDIGMCTGTGANNNTVMRFGNYGWSDAENAAMHFTFTDENGNALPQQLTKNVGTISADLDVDLAPELGGLGVNVNYLSQQRLPCSGEDWSNADYETGPLACIQRARAHEAFGSLGPYLDLHETNLGVWANGTLDYDWRDASGSVHAKSSPFRQWVPLGSLASEVECGEGGAPEDLSIEAFSFDLDRDDYRIQMQMNDDVPPGVTGRWRITLDAPKSSRHDFRIVLQLADGERIASRPIELLYFKPSR